MHNEYFRIQDGSIKLLKVINATGKEIFLGVDFF
jgi:hypothetical protein